MKKKWRGNRRKRFNMNRGEMMLEGEACENPVV